MRERERERERERGERERERERRERESKKVSMVLTKADLGRERLVVVEISWMGYSSVVDLVNNVAE